MIEINDYTRELNYELLVNEYRLMDDSGSATELGEFKRSGNGSTDQLINGQALHYSNYFGFQSNRLSALFVELFLVIF